MVKRKPTEYPPFIPRNAGEWFLWGAYTFVRSFETAIEGIRRFRCSNPTCKKETVFNPQNNIPPGCMYCGDEFDWEGILTEKVKIECKTPVSQIR